MSQSFKCDECGQKKGNTVEFAIGGNLGNFLCGDCVGMLASRADDSWKTLLAIAEHINAYSLENECGSFQLPGVAERVVATLKRYKTALEELQRRTDGRDRLDYVQVRELQVALTVALSPEGT